MATKETKKISKSRPAPLDPARVAAQYLSHEEWADRFEMALTELATERAAQVARVTAFLSRTRPDAQPETVEAPQRAQPLKPTEAQDITMQAIVAYLRDRREPTSAASIAAHFGHAKASAAPGLGAMLKTAVAEGLLRSEGQRRGVKYQVA